MKFNWEKIGGILIIIFFLVFIFGILHISKLISLLNEIERDIYKIEYAMTVTEIKSCSLMCQNRNLSYVNNDKNICYCNNEDFEIKSFRLIIDNDIAGYYLDEYKASSSFSKENKE